MLEGQQPALSVEADADGVEAELRRPRALQPAVGEPLARHRPHRTLLAHPDGGERPERVPRGEPDDACLHLAEDERPRIPGNDVYHPVTGSKVPLDHLEPTRLEMPSS